MTQTDDLARRAELQRLAYGAGTGEAERAAALAELRDAASASGDAPTSGSASASSPAEPDPRAAGDRRAVRRRLGLAFGGAAIAVALGLGVVVWAVSSQQTSARTGGIAGEDSPPEGTGDEPAGSLDEGAAERAEALQVFTRPQIAADLPPSLPSDVDPASFRLLTADERGYASYAARQDDRISLVIRGPDDALVLTWASVDEFRSNGLSITAELSGAPVSASWMPDGRIAFSSG